MNLNYNSNYLVATNHLVAKLTNSPVSQTESRTTVSQTTVLPSQLS